MQNLQRFSRTSHWCLEGQEDKACKRVHCWRQSQHWVCNSTPSSEPLGWPLGRAHTCTHQLQISWAIELILASPQTHYSIVLFLKYTKVGNFALKKNLYMQFESKTKDPFPSPTSASAPIYLCSFWHICVVLNARFRSTDVVMENRN